jgi:hypothetical protein
MGWPQASAERAFVPVQATVALAMFFHRSHAGLHRLGLSRRTWRISARGTAISTVLHSAVLSAGLPQSEPEPDLEAELVVLAARLESDLPPL